MRIYQKSVLRDHLVGVTTIEGALRLDRDFVRTMVSYIILLLA